MKLPVSHWRLWLRCLYRNLYLGPDQQVCGVLPGARAGLWAKCEFRTALELGAKEAWLPAGVKAPMGDRVPSPSGQGALKGTKVLISPTVCTKASQFSSQIRDLCRFSETLDFQKKNQIKICITSPVESLSAKLHKNVIILSTCSLLDCSVEQA